MRDMADANSNVPPPQPSRMRRVARLRPWVQAAFLGVWLGPFGLRLHSIPSCVFHCYACPLASFACPVGVAAQFSALHVVPVLALGVVVTVAAMVGAMVCGWACPFGFLQDLAARVPTPKLKLPSWTGYFRYVVLVGLVLAIPYWLGESHPLFFCSVCPAGALEGAVPNVATQISSGAEDIGWPSAAKIAILGVFVVAIFFTWRPWCTLFCPLGAIFSLCNRVSFLFMRFRADQCNDCDLCRDLCKYRGPGERRGGDLRCIRCLDCVRCRAISVGTVFDRPDGPELVQIAPPQAPGKPAAQPPS